MKIKETKRHLIQLITSIVSNANIKGFIDGKIYTGPTKQVCVPGLNCYSCPGAIGSCPVGALQAQLGRAKKSIPFYILGFLLLFGVLFGRLICGFLCLFGFIQDLLYKIPVPKLTIPKKADRILRYLKYAVLLFMVILFPIILTDEFGTAPPFFCQWICPAGTLEGGIPLVLQNEGLRALLGFLFSWKMALLIIFILSSIFIYRPFCKYICPLGAIYSLFNRFSFYQMHVDKEKCTSCGACEKQCKMQVDILKNINSSECIRCGLCKKVCPHNAITTGIKRKQI